VPKRRARGNRRKQNRRVLHLAQDFGAEEISFRARLHELLEGNRISGIGVGKIFAQHRADLIFVPGNAVPKQIADYRAKEEPP
jgi:hypothetical protein